MSSQTEAKAECAITCVLVCRLRVRKILLRVRRTFGIAIRIDEPAALRVGLSCTTIVNGASETLLWAPIVGNTIRVAAAYDKT